MEWYENAQFAAEENHEPEEFDGREWAELSDKEQQAAIDSEVEHIWTSPADGQ